MKPYLEKLAGVPLFSGLDEDELSQVARVTTELNIDAGTELLSEGSRGREVFIIIEGEAEVIRDGELVATVGPGQIQGELALLLDRPRSASVRAKTDLTIVDIDRGSFNAVLDDVPTIARKMLPIVAKRLEQTG